MLVFLRVCLLMECDCWAWALDEAALLREDKELNSSSSSTVRCGAAAEETTAEAAAPSEERVYERILRDERGDAVAAELVAALAAAGAASAEPPAWVRSAVESMSDEQRAQGVAALACGTLPGTAVFCGDTREQRAQEAAVAAVLALLYDAREGGNVPGAVADTAAALLARLDSCSSSGATALVDAVARRWQLVVGRGSAAELCARLRGVAACLAACSTTPAVPVRQMRGVLLVQLANAVAAALEHASGCLPLLLASVRACCEALAALERACVPSAPQDMVQAAHRTVAGAEQALSSRVGQ